MVCVSMLYCWETIPSKLSSFERFVFLCLLLDDKPFKTFEFWNDLLFVFAAGKPGQNLRVLDVWSFCFVGGQTIRNLRALNGLLFLMICLRLFVVGGQASQNLRVLKGLVCFMFGQTNHSKPSGFE